MASIKIIVMGVGGVGKSAITNRFVIGRWIEKYDPTIEESYQTTIDIDGKALQVEILDTAGQDEYTPLRETFMHTGDGFLLVYSIIDDQTLEELKSIREQILKVHRGKKPPMVVVGNKMDMKKDRAVSKEEGKSLADEFGAGFLEVTAKENFKIKDAFELLVRKILSKNPTAGAGDGSAVAGVFGGGKADKFADEDDSNSPSSSKKKSGSSKSSKKASSPSGASSNNGEAEKKGKCNIL
mmetsp:Transcript_27974/g.38531  ORF Transcript_27974/g.38531 Transcript_27974/m.38531 type:complete len:239 (-) Transcript_27974:1339-2055(-)|eukprot:CAMPEP_0170077142 /NCGR_PEP_ID=MMETSP0019_2-20121128/14016_1 /TAXON_ID=98059 /ORGANISM="Dinobryon sp., Strain UTEXLB2267" /LENGTH=238 /DNA_ID=CAMNT_0010289289 /DNA_START=15 /DNA_END=731 /DNA_ORIENTATION=+